LSRVYNKKGLIVAKKQGRKPYACGDDMHSQIIILKNLKQLFLSYKTFSCGVALFLFFIHSPKAE
jgi:hypothetical protein